MILCEKLIGEEGTSIAMFSKNFKYGAATANERVPAQPRRAAKDVWNVSKAPLGVIPNSLLLEGEVLRTSVLCLA